jgi:superfamily II DNA/RNA helicase
MSISSPKSESGTPNSEELLEKYLGALPYTPYPVQEEAIWTWYTLEGKKSPDDTMAQGVMVCAPTGTGKTLIAESVLFEALHTGQQAYYTTPLIALTDQKFEEIKAAAVSWGFSEDDVGLITGNRKVNPQARILVVVAEILLNRLLHQEAFSFDQCSAVVMDEFHSFNDPERGVVWELSLALLPKHVKLMLLSATVGNAVDFSLWLERSHGRRLEIVQGTERKVPLNYRWIPDQMLSEQLEIMAAGEEHERKTPALVFCFNRAECWNVAELLKGKSLLADGQQKELAKKLETLDFRFGVGPKLKQILMRGVGVHHAGLLPQYRKIVEKLFQQKLLTVCVCTETLAAGINLPARSVVMTSLLKGPPGKEKLVESSTAHQIFGRAGRPQYDKEGFVYALAHEDDVRIFRWKENYDLIPEDTKDPNLLKKKKDLKKKMPTRNPHRQYWNESHFDKLKTAPPAKLSSKGAMPWRLLAYLLKISPDVGLLREFVSKRMFDAASQYTAQKQLVDMLVTLHDHEFIKLDPPPPVPVLKQKAVAVETNEPAPDAQAVLQSEGLFGQVLKPTSQITTSGLFGQKPAEKNSTAKPSKAAQKLVAAHQETAQAAAKSTGPELPDYMPFRAEPTAKLDEILHLRSVNPLYGSFLMEYMNRADATERLQAMESLLEMSGSVAKLVRVPRPDRLPFGPLATDTLHAELLTRGLVTADQLFPLTEEEERERRQRGDDRKFLLTLAEKLKLLFQSDYPGVSDINITAVWCLGELADFDFKFFNYIRARELSKEEGSIFRHALRMIMLLEEFMTMTPRDMDPMTWQHELKTLSDKLTKCCQDVDPHSTSQILVSLHAADVVEGESPQVSPTVPAEENVDIDDFGSGLEDD